MAGGLQRLGRITECVTVLVLALVTVPCVSQGPGSVGFAQERIVVDEDASASLYHIVPLLLLREGSRSGAVAVNIQVRELEQDKLLVGSPSPLTRLCSL